MSYSGHESVELLALRSGFTEISIEATCIQRLSSQMRSISSEVVQPQAIQLWIAHVRESKEPARLLAFLYLANDVIQLLKGSRAQLIYRYRFLPALAESILIIREQNNPQLLAQTERVLQILKERCVYDTRTLDLLKRCSTEPISVCREAVLQALCASLEDTELLACLERLQDEQKERRQAAARTCAPHLTSLSVPGSQHFVTPVSCPPPSAEELIDAGRVFDEMLAKLPDPRPRQCVNLDAEIVSRIRGYRVPMKATIQRKDAQIMAIYEMLLRSHRENRMSIDEKSRRRQREEETSQTNLALSKQTPSSLNQKVQILLKKEWGLRVEKQKLNFIVFWFLMSIFQYLIQRWNDLHSMAENIDTEIKRRQASRPHAYDL